MVVSHQLGKRDLIFAHLCDYFSEDDFGLALSGDVQLVLKRFALREQFFKGGHCCLHYKKSFFEVVWVFDSVLVNKSLARKESRFNNGFAANVSVSLPAGEPARPARPMVAGLAAFRPANFVGVFSSHDAMDGNMPYQPAIQEVLPARRGGFPNGPLY
ncbi:hypothetical protein [Caballeronia sp. KNU42]